MLIDRNSLEPVKAAIESPGDIIPSGIIQFASGTPQAREVFRISRVLNNELFTLNLRLVTPVLHDVWTTKEVFHLPDRRISIVSRKGLTKMKRLAGRLRDLAVLEELGLLEDKP